jgi:hypothetical protein
VWTFNETFTGLVPELGVSRLVSSKRETHSDTVVRRGLAVRLEHGFMDTPEGRAHYFLSLAQISNAVRVSLRGWWLIWCIGKHVATNQGWRGWFDSIVEHSHLSLLTFCFKRRR